jgi:DNA-binding XRE family transcriptional regulator
MCFIKHISLEKEAYHPHLRFTRLRKMDLATTSLKTFGAQFRARRRQAGISQAMLAAAVGVERRVVIDIEKGRGTVAIGRVLQLAREIGLPMATLDDPRPAEPAPQ